MGITTMRQQTLADSSFEKFGKKTRKEQFLERDGAGYCMDRSD